jgi:hypothetical protein
MSDANERPRFRVSIGTRTIYDRIARMTMGEVVTYREFSDLVNEDVTLDGRGTLNSARRMAQRDLQIVTDTVRKTGIKRLTDVEVVDASDASFGELRRAARRGIDRTTAITDFERLPNDKKIRHNAAVSALGVIAALSKPKEIRKLEGAVNTSQTGQLPIGRTLELLRRPMPVPEDETEAKRSDHG